ncbi:MAG: kelch repeat-containing protein, partial [Candidatus Binataceae bacterium]
NPWDVQATAIAFHAARHRTVLFGGWSQSHNSSFGQTWEWDGTTWTKQTPTLSPSADSGHSLAYDSTRQMVVLAGSTAQGAATWEYDATGQWNKRMPATPPGSHVGIGLAYDSNRGVTVLFGGKASNSDLDDTWEWNGTNWALMATSGPTPRRALAMTYDSLRKRTFMFGGASGHSPTTPHNDVWSWQ